MSVNIKTFYTERNILSLLLTASASGLKLKPFIVFKSNYISTKKNKLNKNIHIVNKDLFVVCQENSWKAKDIFDYWLYNILFPYGRFIYKNAYNY